tara:strand:- start:882 stop:1220 length:339 start_codon:yes stop_codon:yes gene_type:complete
MADLSTLFEIYRRLRSLYAKLKEGQLKDTWEDISDIVEYLTELAEIVASIDECDRRTKALAERIKNDSDAQRLTQAAVNKLCAYMAGVYHIDEAFIAMMEEWKRESEEQGLG